MSYYLCNTREGHLHAVYKIICYLQATIHRNTDRVVFDGARKDMTNKRLFDSCVTDLD